MKECENSTFICEDCYITFKVEELMEQGQEKDHDCIEDI